MPSQGGRSTRVLTTVPHEVPAGIIVAALEREGILASASGVLTAAYRTEVPGRVQILVRGEDLPRARDVLARIEQEADDIDWSQVDVGTPADA